MPTTMIPLILWQLMNNGLLRFRYANTKAKVIYGRSIGINCCVVVSVESRNWHLANYPIRPIDAEIKFKENQRIKGNVSRGPKQYEWFNCGVRFLFFYLQKSTQSSCGSGTGLIKGRRRRIMSKLSYRRSRTELVPRGGRINYIKIITLLSFYA